MNTIWQHVITQTTDKQGVLSVFHNRVSNDNCMLYVAQVRYSTDVIRQPCTKCTEFNS